MTSPPHSHIERDLDVVNRLRQYANGNLALTPEGLKLLIRQAADALHESVIPNAIQGRKP